MEDIKLEEDHTNLGKYKIRKTKGKNRNIIKDITKVDQGKLRRFN